MSSDQATSSLCWCPDVLFKVQVAKGLDISVVFIHSGAGLAAVFGCRSSWEQVGLEISDSLKLGFAVVSGRGSSSSSRRHLVRSEIVRQPILHVVDVARDDSKRVVHRGAVVVV